MDKEVEQKIAQKGTAEARDWLDAAKYPNHSVMEMSAENARAMVAGFYERGAEKVFVLDPTTSGNSLVTAQFAVKLPKDAAARQKCACGAGRQSTRSKTTHHRTRDRNTCSSRRTEFASRLKTESLNRKPPIRKAWRDRKPQQDSTWKRGRNSIDQRTSAAIFNLADCDCSASFFMRIINGLRGVSLGFGASRGHGASRGQPWFLVSGPSALGCSVGVPGTRAFPGHHPQLIEYQAVS